MANGAIMTAEVDASGLQSAIPRIVAFGRRTIQQVCTTSGYWICVNAKAATEKIDVDTIDARLNAQVISYTKGGKLSKAKKRTKYRDVKFNGNAVGASAPLGVLVVMARMNPGSRFNLLTGGHYALPRSVLPHGKGSWQARMQTINDLVNRMIASRRSTSAYVKAGWIHPMRELFKSPHMVKSGAFLRSAAAVGSTDDAGAAKMNVERLGYANVSASGDSITVTAENLTVKTGANQALQQRHEQYGMAVGAPALQSAINQEESNINAKIADYVAAGLKAEFTDI